MMTIGRAGWGIGYAATSRYTTSSIIALVSLMYLLVIVLEDARKRWPTAMSDVAEARLVTCLLSFMISMHLATAVYMIPQWETRRSNMLQFKTFVTFVNLAHLDSASLEDLTGLSAQTLEEDANWLNLRGQLHPPVLQSDLLPPATDPPPGKSIGFVESLQPQGDQLVIEGWAILPDERAANGILICWAGSGGPRHIFKVVSVNRPRPDLMAEGQSKPLACGWATTFSRSSIPPGADEISAWAYDAANNEIYQLKLQK